MEITEGRIGEATMLRVVGRVDGSVSKLLERKVADVTAVDRFIIIDVAEMSYVSSAGLRPFVTLAKHAQAKSRVVSLCGMRDEIAEIFDISGLLGLFAVHDTVEAAIAALPR
ncbi:MAG: STAS domain-containing protein [Xanthobacteraceae bacterium]|jgi:anti-anti-sigma factor